jgi:protein-tyrosine phosphatase
LFFLFAMIDLHCHILPGVDDGSKDLAMSLEMGRIAANDGITDIVCTPHVYCGFGPFQPRDSAPAVAALQTAFDASGIPIRLHACCEMPLLENYRELLHDGRWLPYDPASRYYLLEMPPIPHGFPILERAVAVMLSEDCIPVLAHPERLEMLADSGRVRALHSAGALFQVTASCYASDRSIPEYRQRALDWLDNGWVAVVATDAHRPDRRPPLLAVARSRVAATYGEDVAQALFETHPRAILDGKDL